MMRFAAVKQSRGEEEEEKGNDINLRSNCRKKEREMGENE